MSINIVYSNALENWSIEKAQEIVEESLVKLVTDEFLTGELTLYILRLTYMS